MTKATMIMELLNKHPDWSLSRIAKEAGSHVSYVHMLRKKMVHVDGLMEDAVEEAPANTRQEGGSHYKDMAIQPWDVYDSWPAEQRIGAYRANCVKYVMRLDTKDSRLLNARKLAHYAQKLVEVLEELEK